MGNYKGIPMKKKHIGLIEQGIKRTTLRDLKYAYYPFKKEIINVPEDLTQVIACWEGYNNIGELLDELERLRHKLPKKMFIYFLDKPINSESISPPKPEGMSIRNAKLI